MSTENKTESNIADNLAAAMRWIHMHGGNGVSSVHVNRYNPTVFFNSLEDMAARFPGDTAKVARRSGYQEYTLERDGFRFRATVYEERQPEHDEVVL